MEHLPCSPRTAKIHIPYLGIEDYDDGDFATYPERHGWDKEKIFLLRDFTGKDPKDVEAFFQTWLYFGLLICTFRTVGIVVSTADFLRAEGGELFVTTERLPEYLLDWNHRENIALIRLRGGDPTEAIHRNGKATQWPLILTMLTEVHQYVNRYCNEQSQRFAEEMQLPEKFFVKPMSPLLSLSIIALASAISRAATRIYEISYSNLYLNWGTSSFLTERLFSKGFCPKDVAWLTSEKDQSIDVQYTLACLPYSRRETNHSECTDSICCLDQVDLNSYSTRHVNAQCSCVHVEISQDILPIIENGGVPIISFRTRQDERDPELRVIQCQPKARYVAISHV